MQLLPGAPILANSDGVPLKMAKIRCLYPFCWYCQYSEPEAMVQGKRGAWYHLHPRSGNTIEYPMGELHQALLAELDPLEYEAIFGWEP